jgi:toxin ParE1/3/4
MKVVWAARAKRELRELIVYIAGESPQNAELAAERILTAAEQLARMPRSGRAGRVPNTRERIVRRTPYILISQAAAGRVRILRVYHAARRWPARID